MSCLRREYNEIYQKKVTERKNISIVYRREARELSNNNREQRWPSRSASSLSSSPRLLLHSLSFVFSCFVFTVECTWCCLSIAWVAIDFPSLCSVGGCMMLKFRGTQDSVVALCSFFMSSPWFQPIHKSQKMPCLSLPPTRRPLNAGLGVTVWSPQTLHDFPPEQQDAL